MFLKLEPNGPEKLEEIKESFDILIEPSSERSNLKCPGKGFIIERSDLA
jgi:hypothetical protein